MFKQLQQSSGRPGGSRATERAEPAVNTRREQTRLDDRSRPRQKSPLTSNGGGMLAVPTNEPLPFDDSLNERGSRPEPEPRATSGEDHKTYWGTGEIIMWIRTRNEERVAAMSGLSETEAMALALFIHRVQKDPRPLARFQTLISDGDCLTGAPHGKGMPFHIDEPGMMDPRQASDDLERKGRSGRVQITAIRCNGSSDEQTPVPPVELNDLIFQFVPNHPVAPVALWSRSRGELVWRAPQFRRVNALRVWPARNAKTAAVSGAILRHLRKIMIPESPLTKLEAHQRCLAEVPNAYPEAFNKAWAKLEASYKRGRGKHGPRGR